MKAGPATAISALWRWVAEPEMDTYAGTKKIKEKFMSFKTNPSVSQPYAALNCAVSPNMMATILWANSWKMMAGAVMRAANCKSWRSTPRKAFFDWSVISGSSSGLRYLER